MVNEDKDWDPEFFFFFLSTTRKYLSFSSGESAGNNLPSLKLQKTALAQTQIGDGGVEL